MTYCVYVQNADGKPLDPTERFGWVRRSLRDGKAIVVKRKPFTIRLTYQVSEPVVGKYIGGTDPGRTNIGNAVIREDKCSVVYTDHVETRNKEIPSLMKKRLSYRQASRRGERLARKRLAKKYGTLSAKLQKNGGRKIPGCEKIVPVKDIINTEARFANRKRRSNMTDTVPSAQAWVTPTVKQLVQTHLNHVDQIREILPVSGWCLEINKFAFMKMDDGSIHGVDFQNGRLKGFASVNDYVYALQNGKCACCGKQMSDVHHIVPRSKDGSDGPDNRIGLCEECHHKVHIGELNLEKVGMRQKYGALSVLNQAIPFIYCGLVERFGEENVSVCFGKDTSVVREVLRLPKDHDKDAIAIISACTGMEPSLSEEHHFEVKQFRKHNRAIINNQRERTYKLDGVAVAKNRKPRLEQKGAALSVWREKYASSHSEKEAEKMIGQLSVEKSTRRYNEKNRTLPGMTFEFNGVRYIMSGQLSGGKYLRAVGCGSTNFPISKCRILTTGEGMVYL